MSVFVLVYSLTVSLNFLPPESQNYSTDTFDCGTLSLYNLMSIELGSSNLLGLRKSLGSTSSSGYSMVELRDIAREHGLPLNLARLNNDPKAIDRPCLVYLKRGQHGHYIVIRPVGHSRRLLQVIDGVQPPEIVEAIALFSSPEWTGYALYPARRKLWILSLSLGLAVAFTLTFIHRKYKIRIMPPK